MRRLVGKLCLFLPLLGAVAALNYQTDPAHLFHADSYARAVAAILLAGSNVAAGLEGDERLVQRYTIGGLARTPDVVVLGSSHAMQVGSSVFPGKTVFNHCVSQASLRDMLAIYEMYAARGMAPRTVVLGLDPWTLNAHSGLLKRRFSLADEYRAAQRRLGLPVTSNSARADLRSRLRGYLRLVSPAYLQASLGSLAGGGAWPRPTTADVGDEPLRLRDGTVSYSRRQQAKSPTEVNDEIRRAISAGPRSGDDEFAGFDRLDPGLARELEGLVGYLRARRTRVILFLAPVHPLTYEYMMATPRLRISAEAERYYRALARRQNLDLVGSYDPANCGCTGADFYNADHARAECVARLFAQRRSAVGPR